jgi:predicted acyltransferase
LPAIANCLIGVFAGMVLRDPKRDDRTKVIYLAAAGLVLVAAGWLWSAPPRALIELQFPLIKKIWTSSFVLVACGYSCLLLSAFHLVIEAWGWRCWAQPFVWIGANPITIYLISELIDVQPIAKRFVGGDLNKYFGRYGQLAIAIVGLLIIISIARFMYRRKIFLRL